ncbi:glutamate 5-kinase [Thermoplasmatales archaeon BRNA1]|nr:glutamate 5-kinase [Thermoplasmatales archaeon BRNA1]
MEGRRELLADTERVVFKIGTSSIIKDGNVVSEELMDSVARQVAELKKRGKEVLIVSSGAIGIGLRVLDARPKPNEVPIKQAAAAVGQGVLMQKWNDSFQKYGITVAQILISLDDYSNRDTVLNLNNTMTTLLKYGAVPIFNENDAIATKEIGPMFGDNDTLSAVIASRADADLLVILSDVAGLYDKNPQVHGDAKLIPVVTDIESVQAVAGGAGTKMGTGGMKTKLKAAKICQDAGCLMVIASSAEDDVLIRTVSGDEVGTVFIADSAITKKRRWLKSVNPNGKIVIDAGAGKAILEHRSLLPVGVKCASGPFEAGKPVDIVCEGVVIARGIPDYGSEDINSVKGMRSDEAKKVLGVRMNHKDVVRSENIAIMP